MAQGSFDTGVRLMFAPEGVAWSLECEAQLCYTLAGEIAALRDEIQSMDAFTRSNVVGIRKSWNLASASSVAYKDAPLERRCPTEMAKPGRNDPCPCGSGKKYKKCCLTNDEAAEKEQLVAEHAEREERAAAKRQELRKVREAITANFAASDLLDDDFGDELMDASNRVVALIRAGKLDEAEAAARDLLVRYPDTHDGWDRLGMVHEARGENVQAAECYRKLIASSARTPTTLTPNGRALHQAERQARPAGNLMLGARSRSPMARTVPTSTAVISRALPRPQTVRSGLRSRQRH